MRHKQILLIDDDEDDVFIFKDAMYEIACKIECMTAENGLEAISLLRQAEVPPSLIFLDLNMPIMNGFECLKQIKQIEFFKKIPVIIFSTSNSPADRKKATELGADIFFTKTADFKLLKTTLLKILETNFTGALHSL